MVHGIFSCNIRDKGRGEVLYSRWYRKCEYRLQAEQHCRQGNRLSNWFFTWFWMAHFSIAANIWNFIWFSNSIWLVWLCASSDPNSSWLASSLWHIVGCEPKGCFQLLSMFTALGCTANRCEYSQKWMAYLFCMLLSWRWKIEHSLLLKSNSNLLFPKSILAIYRRGLWFLHQPKSIAELSAKYSNSLQLGVHVKVALPYSWVNHLSLLK